MPRRGGIRGAGRVSIVPALAAAVWCLSATAGSYVPPGGDYAAQWLSSSVVALIGVDQNYTYGVRIVDVDAATPEERFIAPARALLVSPSKQLLAFELDLSGRESLVVSAPDGSHRQTLFDGAAEPVRWLPDSSRLIFAVPNYFYGGVSSRFYSSGPTGATSPSTRRTSTARRRRTGACSRTSPKATRPRESVSSPRTARPRRRS